MNDELNMPDCPFVKPACLLTLCGMLVSASALNAITYEWNVTGTAGYNDANNWTPNGIAGANDVIQVNNGGTVSISATDPDWSVARIELGTDVGDSGSIDMSGGDFYSSGEVQIGKSGDGAFTLSGGNLASGNHFYLALGAGTTGVFNLSDGVVNAATDTGKETRFGWRGDGTMNMTGGEFNTTTLKLGPRGGGRPDGIGTINQSSGEINASLFSVGDSYNSARTESGVYNLSGDGLLEAGDFIVGREGGSGRVEMTGGDINVSNFLAIGHNDGASGIFNQSGGTVNRISGISYVARQASGDAASGTWTLSGSAVANLDDVLIAQGIASGTFNLNGGTLSATQIRTEVSGSGMSILNLNGGEVVARSSNATFLEGLTEANVQAGGVTFDTDGNDITIGQDLLDDGAGDVIKAGVGVMTFSGDNTYLGDTVVQAGTLILADGGSMTFAIGEDGSSNMITGTGTVDLSGLLVFDFENLSSSTANAWTIVDSSLTASYGETFSILNFTESGAGIWTLEADNLTYTFSESTGILSAVPEPAQFALLMGLLVVGASVARRKPRVVA